MKHINTYPNPDPPHELAFKYMFERVQWRLKELQDEATCVYDQTKFLDDEMHEASMKLMRDGSSVQYVSDFYG